MASLRLGTRRVRVSVTGIPTILASPDLFERRKRALIESQLDITARNLTDAGKAGYISGRIAAGFQPVREYSDPLFIGGTENAYWLFPLAEYPTGPGYFPPYGPGSRLAWWVDHLAQAPATVGHTRPLNAFLAARSIYRHGTKGKRVMDKPFKQEALRLERALNAGFKKLLGGR